MAKTKKDEGVTESDMVDLTADKTVELEDDTPTSDEQANSSERSSNLQKVLGQSAEQAAPENVLDVIQKARNYAITKAIEEDPANAAIVLKDIFKDTAQTATQQQRNQIEKEGNKELAAAIAKNNTGVIMRKRPGDKVDEATKAKGNSVKDIKIDFGNSISDQEIGTDIVSPDFDEMVKAETEAENNRRATSKKTVVKAAEKTAK